MTDIVLVGKGGQDILARLKEPKNMPMLIVVKDLMGTGTVRGYRYFLLKTEH
jgi:hypothetical protein